MTIKSIGNIKQSERVGDEPKDYETLSSLCSRRGASYDELGLYDESLKEHEAAAEYMKLIAEPDKRHYQASLVYYNMTPYYQDRSNEKVLYYLKKSREEVLKINNNSKDIPLEKKIDMLVSINMNLGIHYRDRNNKGRNVKLSEFHFMEALKQFDLVKGDVLPNTKIDLYQALQEFYQMKKDYKKAIEYGENMLILEKSNSMPYNRRVGYMVLAKSYLGIGDHSTSQKYLDLFQN